MSSHTKNPKIPLLSCQNISKKFGDKVVLNNINLEISHGKIIGLLGQNGAGKSTLIKLCNDLLTPTTGQISFEDQPLGVNSKLQISYLPERTYLDKTMRVRDAIQFFSEFYSNFDIKKSHTLIQNFQLDLDTRISKMSKGMQEKLQLALVMSRKAKLYILDEPLGGVDPAARDHILDTILNNFDDGASILISTHLIADIERILDEVIFIQDGKTTLQSDADKLRAHRHASIDEIFRKEFKNAR